MGLTLGGLDWVVVALLAVVSAALAAAAFLLSRRFTAGEILNLRNQLRLLEPRLAALERSREERPAATPAARPSRPLPHPLPAQAPPPEPVAVSRSMETITQAASAALASLETFRRFTQAEGGSGFVVSPGRQECLPAPGPDPASTADVWAVPFEGAWLYFPGFNLRRSQSSLLADAGRMARDRLGWLFEIEAGEQLAAFRPAIQRDGDGVQRGLLTLPF